MSFVNPAATFMWRLFKFEILIRDLGLSDEDFKKIVQKSISNKQQQQVLNKALKWPQKLRQMGLAFSNNAAAVSMQSYMLIFVK